LRVAYLDWADCFEACGDPQRAEQARCLSPVWFDAHLCFADHSAHVVDCMRRGRDEMTCRIEAAGLHMCSFRDRFDACAIDP
jgi:hypothetical protein